jgi:hypothetical protein
VKFGLNNCSEAKGLGIFANLFPAVRHAWRFLPSGLDENLFDFTESFKRF